MRSLTEAVSQGADAAFAVDGPRGPLNKVKAGAILAAKNTGAIIIPITTKADRAWIFGKAWDNYLLPKPFAKVDLIRGEGLVVKDITQAKDQLEKSLLELTD